MKEIIKLLRPHQYIKNSFIFLPLFFAGKITEQGLAIDTAIAVAAFCLVASGIYVLNDFFDRDADRQHPVKKFRPIAAGTVSNNAAIVLFILLLSGGLGLMLCLNLNAFYFTAGYAGLNIAYSFGLKHIPILDITFISVGFVLRLFVGEAAGNGQVPLSMWIILITYMLALFLALAKRRDDVLLAVDGKKVRKVVDGYNLEFINGGMIVMASVTVVSYILYTISPEVNLRLHSNKLYYTVIFVILGILRYMQITFVENKSGSPTKVLIQDLFLQLVLAGWVITYFVIIYGTAK